MSGLYTVHMVSKHVRVSYEQFTGRVMHEEVREVPLAYHDLPLQTALTYRDRFPDAQVRILNDAGIVIDTSGLKAPEPEPAPIGIVGPSAFETQVSEQVKLATVSEYKRAAPTPARSDIAEAAMSGDFAAAINAELKETR